MENINTKFRKFSFKIIVMFILILGICVSSIAAFNIIDTYGNRIYYDIEQERRNEARLILENIVKELEHAISNNDVDIWDDASLHEWAVSHLGPVRNGSHKSNGFMINIGFSAVNFNKSIFDSLIEQYPITINEKNIIYEMTRKYSIRNKSNHTIKQELYALSQDVFNTIYEINIDTKITASHINNLYLSIFFVKEKFIYNGGDIFNPEAMASSKYMDDEPKLHKFPEHVEEILEHMRTGMKTKYGDNYSWDSGDGIKWLEWVISPDNIMGYDSSPNAIHGIANVGYKKLVIVLGTQSDEVISVLDKSHDILLTLKPILLTNIFLSVITAAVLFTILFLNILKQEPSKE